MRRVRITMDITATEEFYDKNLKPAGEDILSGKFQREMTNEKEGAMLVKATFEEL
jgi:hypothetical protein